SIVPNAVSGVSITDINLDTANLNALTKHDYTIRFNGPAAGDYEVVDNVTNSVVSTGNLPGAGTITFAGLSVDFDGQPTIGDTYDLNYDGRVGMTGDVYSIEWTNATDYEIYNLSTRDPNPVATGTLVGNGLIFFDGLAVDVSGARVAGDSFRIDYAQMSVDSSLTPATVAASGSAPGLAEPGNNDNAVRMADLGLKNLGGLSDRTFSLFQGSQIASAGNEKASNSVLLNAQNNFVSSLEIQRESVSGVNLDEEAADLIQFQQNYTAAARYISSVNELMDFLISVLGG
ncbi:MAG: hypothetical protein MI919_01080, partial [Holophagales bacterium]|nr:hypothetical protein [Holophagales bacterium]